LGRTNYARNYIHRFSIVISPSSARTNSSLTSRDLFTFISDIASSLAVIGFGFLLRYNDMNIADTLQCLTTSAFILQIVWPLFVSTGVILLQQVPSELAASIARARREVSVIDGVLEVVEEHFWIHAPGQAIASLILRTRQGVNSNDIRKKVETIYAGLVQDLTIQVEPLVA
jgi:Co/Zn/Cd efflux system component